MRNRFSLVTMLVVAVGSPAAAQTRAVDAHLFRPALFASGLLGVERGTAAGPFQPSFSFNYSFESAPLRLHFLRSECNPPGCPGTQDVISSAHLFYLGGSLGLLRRLELAFELPVVRQSLAVNGTPEADAGFELLARSDLKTNIPAAEVAPLDARVGVKVHLWQRGPLALAAAVQSTIPLGDEEVFAGESSFTVQPKVLASLDRGAVGVALNVGVLLRKEAAVVWDDPETKESGIPLLGVGNEFTFAAGLVYRWRRIGLVGEIFGTVPFARIKHEVVTTESRFDPVSGRIIENTERRLVEAPRSPTAELLGGLTFQITRSIQLSAAAGAGVAGAQLQPALRILAGASWLPGGEESVAATRDRDGDGIPDGRDLCPDRPEDKDDVDDEDGCPDLDNDGDQIPDAKDACPEQAEDPDGHQDADGCPDLDNESDGTPDEVDRCPDQAEDKDGFQDDDGCPDLDNDGDAIPDGDDQCPNEPETKNGFQDDDGCPDSAPAGGGVSAHDRRSSPPEATSTAHPGTRIWKATRAAA